ncbi:vitamin K epoxide reductase family protein [Lyngbya confervoides]|uniref:Vitamin K epoxide reductase family protein n=1 Tax=Lyngbya confervoides BDU141951 TaxID=1574623 RepID=A0ABD4T357_9CYAN|nr:vitamin K epoxide reductase family protein [Lyngbya confervoides]MCM1982780.1 vitamin K epoxide reductase family protein [Lyngbya confervoides BDU141951]
MSRRRRSPWIHRWSRPIIGAIAILGAINTLYLTVVRFLGSSTVCPTDGCEQVLSSRYATVFGPGNAVAFGDGIPLAFFGLLAYVVMAGLALGPLALNSDTHKDQRLVWEKRTWFLLFLGSTAMMLFSGYLMYIMATEFVIPNGLKALCFYCVASAILATAMFILTLIGRAWEDLGQLFFSGIILGVITLLSTLIIFAPIPDVADAYNITDNTGKVVFSVTQESTASEIALAQHLKDTGAVMYGAFWCPHCYDQKNLFGVEALSIMPYVECDPRGKAAQPDLCQQKFDLAKEQLKTEVGFPTWEINGRFYSGARPLSELAKVSGYEGPQDFQN